MSRTVVDAPVHTRVHVPSVTVTDVPVQKLGHVLIVSVVQKTAVAHHFNY